MATWYFGNGCVEEVSGSGKTATLENGASISGGRLQMSDGSQHAFDFRSCATPFVNGTDWTVYLQNANVTTSTGNVWLNYLSFGDSSTVCDCPNTKGNLRMMSHSAYGSESTLDDWCKTGFQFSPKINGTGMDLYFMYNGSGGWQVEDVSGSINTSPSYTVQDCSGMPGHQNCPFGWLYG
ncbi:MAG: hypothetical protein ACYTEL_23640 [Planctomycetota bacterium]|jgi:hypothetical protein